MGFVSRFEDLEAWREARKVTVQAYAVVELTAADHDVALADQVKRAAMSAMNNLASGAPTDRLTGAPIGRALQ